MKIKSLLLLTFIIIGNHNALFSMGAQEFQKWEAQRHRNIIVNQLTLKLNETQNRYINRAKDAINMMNLTSADTAIEHDGSPMLEENNAPVLWNNILNELLKLASDNDEHLYSFISQDEALKSANIALNTIKTNTSVSSRNKFHLLCSLKILVALWKLYPPYKAWATNNLEPIINNMEIALGL